MKKEVYVPSLLAALFLSIVILIVLDPNFDRQHNILAIKASELIFVANLASLILYFFMRAAFAEKLARHCIVASMAAIVLLTITSQPNLEVKRVFTATDSQLTLENPSKP